MTKSTETPLTSTALSPPSPASPDTETVLYVLACSAIAAAMLPAQTPSLGKAPEPKIRLAFGVPLSLNKSLLTSGPPWRAIATGATAVPTRAAPAAIAANFLMLNPFIFVSPHKSDEEKPTLIV